MPVGFRLERPLGLGEILDRAVSHLVSSWKSVLGLIAVSILPRAALHYYVSSLWLEEYGYSLHKNTSDSVYAQALVTNFQRNAIDTGSLGGTSSVAYDILALLMIAACAVIVTEASEGRTIGAFEALKYVGGRWEIVAPVIAILTVLLFGVREAVSLATHAYMSSAAMGGPTTMIVYSFGSIWSTVTLCVQTFAFIVAVGVVTASLESESVAESIAWGLRGMTSKGRIALTLFMAAALSILYLIALNLTLGGALLLDLTGSPLLDTIWYVVVYTLPLAFSALSAIWFYLDWEFRSSSHGG